MFVNVFLKVLKLQKGHWNLQVGHGVTRCSAVRHPWSSGWRIGLRN